MKNLKMTLITSAIVLLAVIILFSIFEPEYMYVGDEIVSYGWWALVPPIIAISLALITKEVYPSLFVGIISGVIIYSQLDIVTFLQTLTYDVDTGGGVFFSTVTDSGKLCIVIFLIALGALVALMKYSGASKAFGDWAREKIKTRSGASLSTMLLGIFIFVDDYFNCLTVGSVMKPVTDDHNISRAKLAYIIDCTAAPVCIIAPISSWAAAVSSNVPGDEGIGLFLQAIPYNFYALFTLLMVALVALLTIDFGPMRKHEVNAINGDLFSGSKVDGEVEVEANPLGKIIDMIAPIVILVVVCVFFMVYTGGIFDGASFIEAFGNCSSSVALGIGGVVSLLLIMIYYCARGLTTSKQCFDSIPEGFRAMFSAIFILIFAWTLNTITGTMLGADVYISELMADGAENLAKFLPAVIFIVAAFLAFSTGTSWGTFGILIPIVLVIFDPSDPLYVIGLSACLAGAVCGDHISPVSDTTIMASAGAQCDLLTHVNTQIPYALYVAGVAFISFIIAGIVQNAFVPLLVGAALLVAGLMIIKYVKYKGITPEDEAASLR